VPHNTDDLIVESVSTHRQRLRQAFLLGEMSNRRTISDNIKRFIWSVVLTAVVCAGCVGFSFVHSYLTQQASASAQATEIVSETHG